MSALINVYDETHANGNLYGFSTKAQTFYNGGKSTLTSSAFYIANGNSATGSVVSCIYSLGGEPNKSGIPSALLATSDSIDISTISSSLSKVSFTFSGVNQIELLANMYYVVSIEPTITSGYLDVQDDEDIQYYLGNMSAKIGGFWVSATPSGLGTPYPFNMVFWVYGDFPSSPLPHFFNYSALS